MANLLITIIAVALVVVAAIAATYYGSTSWNQGQTKARATTLINQREQLKTAAAVYKSTVGRGSAATSIEMLISENLIANNPAFENATWDAAGEKIYVAFPANLNNAEAAEEICAEAFLRENPDATVPEIPYCSNLENDHVCCKL